MKIVINGGGGVGHALASVLSEEQHDVTVLEPNASRADALEGAVDCHVVVGPGSTPADLRLAAAGQSDIFLAVTNRDEVNLLSCLIARKLGCPKTIARVRHPSFRADDPAVPVSELGVDQIINPDQEAAQEIVYLLRNPGVTQIVTLANGAVAVAGITIAEGGPLDGRSLAELPDVLGRMVYRMAVIRRHGKAIVPTGKDLVQAGDEVFVIAEPETIEQIGRIACPTADRGQKPPVMVFGASDLG
ncbi:MAG: NAD-binding protein, partial [Phycisphaerae bacterium]|nr:NAD-binding protein [Phycisphaerae bacterium]